MSRLQKRRLLKAVLIVVGLMLLAAAVAGGWYSIKAGRLRAKKSQGCYLVRAMKRNELLQASDLAVFDYEGEAGAYITPAQAEGTRLMSDLEAGVRLTEESVYEGEPLTEDMRIHKYTCIRLTERMKKGDYVDIRISFANGADFILLSKKQIQDITLPQEEGEGEYALWLNVSEEEILRLSSAAVDAYLSEGCSIYAIQYIQKSQKAAVMNYKVNDVVAQLIADDPNIVKKAENVLEWELWNEYREEGNTLPVDEATSYEEEEGREAAAFSEEKAEDEIIYFD